MPRILHHYLVSFRETEIAPEVRNRLAEYKAVEIAMTTWIVPWFGPLVALFCELQRLAGPSAGIFVAPLSLRSGLIGIQNRDDLMESLKSVGVHFRTE